MADIKKINGMNVKDEGARNSISELEKKAHEHDNEEVLDSITQEKIAEWDEKSEFDGDYNSLKNKPAIPTKVSDLTNDKNYVTNTEMQQYVSQNGGGNGAGNNSSSYTLPIASATTLGGVKIGSNLSIDSNGVLSASLDSSNIGGLSLRDVQGGEIFNILIACEGVSFASNNIKFVSLDAKNANLILTPANCTEEVVWDVEPKGVVEINDGVITPIMNGNCIISVTCGNYSATCNVEVATNVAYATDDLALMYDFSQYENGYTGDIVDTIVGHQAVAEYLAPQRGRNGIVNGALMLGDSHYEGTNLRRTTFKIPNHESFVTYPFSVEIYTHLRVNYVCTAPEGTYTFDTQKPINPTAVFTTMLGGTTGNGLKGVAFTDKIGIIGPVATPNVVQTLETPLVIDGLTDSTTITDRYYHIVYCMDEKGQTVYLDGVKIVSATANSISLANSDRDMDLFSETLKGDVKLIRIYNRILSENEVVTNRASVLSN